MKTGILFVFFAGLAVLSPVLAVAQGGAAAGAVAPAASGNDTGKVSLGPDVGRLNFDINYPGAALRYFVADGKGLELFGQSQDEIFTGGLRYYYYPKSLAKGALWPYIAGEADLTSFKGRYSKGTGIGGGLSGGVEYFVGRRVSFQADLGALYLSIQDKDTSLGESGLEFVANFGFNFYFGGGSR